MRAIRQILLFLEILTCVGMVVSFQYFNLPFTVPQYVTVALLIFVSAEVLKGSRSAGRRPVWLEIGLTPIFSLARTLGSSKNKGSLGAVGILVAILGIGCLATVALTLNSGGSVGLLLTVSKSGFPAAFALIFVSEIGDKVYEIIAVVVHTFFIAALLAMRHSKWLVLIGASGALALKTIISVVIGKPFQRVPAQLQTTLPMGEYAAMALLIWFGLRSIKNAWNVPSAPSGPRSQPEELGKLAEAEEFIKQAKDKKVTTPLEILGEAFTLIFVAEWGDQSMLATIALGAAQSPWGVASGAIAGHVLAALLAVVGGALLARYISEKLIGYIGGFLFLVFAAATLAGVF